MKITLLFTHSQTMTFFFWTNISGVILKYIKYDSSKLYVGNE